MKAIIEIELGNDSFGDTPAERLFEMQNVMERLVDRAGKMMAVDAGDFVTAQDGNGNTVARMDIVEND
jgi:dihydroxyacetone kinase